MAGFICSDNGAKRTELIARYLLSAALVNCLNFMKPDSPSNTSKTGPVPGQTEETASIPPPTSAKPSEIIPDLLASKLKVLNELHAELSKPQAEAVRPKQQVASDKARTLSDYEIAVLIDDMHKECEKRVREAESAKGGWIAASALLGVLLLLILLGAPERLWGFKTRIMLDLDDTELLHVEFRRWLSPNEEFTLHARPDPDEPSRKCWMFRVGTNDWGKMWLPDESP